MRWDVLPGSPIVKSCAAILGFVLHRQASGSHEIWRNQVTGRMTTIPNHRGDMPEGTLRAVLKAGRVTPEQFLDIA